MSSTGRVPLLDENDRFPDRFAPPSVATDAAAAEAARAGSVAAASGAEVARDESVAAAERAEAVPAQVDTAMADLVGTGGEFDTKLNATIGAEVATNLAPIADQAVEDAAAGLDIVTRPVADAAYAQAALSMHMARRADIKRRKGGVIGTSGKPVIAFQIAHQLDEFKATIWPEFRARNLPVGWGSVTSAVGDPEHGYEPTTATWADVRQHFYEGAEVWSHSRTHLEPLPAVPLDPRGNGDTIRGEIEGSRLDIEANGLYAQGWQTAGVYPSPVTPYYTDFMGPTVEDMEGWASEVGQTILANYGLMSFISAGATRFLPTDGMAGLGYWTFDQRTFAQTKAQIDLIVDRPGMGLVLAMHPKNIGLHPGNMTFADFVAVLDYVKGLWDAGAVEIVTQSGLAFADPSSTHRADLLVDNGFEGTTTQTWTLAGGALRQTDGGRTGANYARLPSGTGSYVAQSPGANMRVWGAHGMVFMFDGWARNVHASSTSNARVLIYANTPSGVVNLRDVSTTLQAASDWKRIRIPFGIPKDATNVVVQLMRAGIGVVDWDDVHQYAV